MDCPMPRQAIHVFESCCAYHHVEVTFNAIGKTRVPAMAFRIIDNLQRMRREGFAQLIFDFLPFRHFFSLPPFLWVHAV